MVVGVGSRNIYGSFIQIVEHQGWKGLWAGYGINMLRIVPTRQLSSEHLSVWSQQWRYYRRIGIRLNALSCSLVMSVWAFLSPVAVAGAAAGIVSTLVCHPLEVLKVCMFGICFLGRSWLVPQWLKYSINVEMNVLVWFGMVQLGMVWRSWNDLKFK